MKALVQDILSIFSPQTVSPVFIHTGLSQDEKNAIKPMGVTTVTWATSMEEITDALLRKATEAGAVGYHITHVDSHKPGNDQQHILEATATLYALDEKALQRA